MSDIFTVVLDLSHVKNDNKSNQLYLAMADTTKMKKIYEFKHYIQFLFSLGCSVELFHEGVRLPDLEDIRVLSRLDVVQVRPENINEGEKLISKSKGYNEKYGDVDSRPVPGDSAANYNYIDSKENVFNYKSLEPGKIVQAQEVSGFGDHGKAEMSCGPSFPADNRVCRTVQKPKKNMMRNKMCDMQENKSFRLGEETGMAENLKLAALLQNRYYGWYGTPRSNIATGRSHFQKCNEMPDIKSGERPCLSKSSGKCTDDDGREENKPYVANEEDVNVSMNTFIGTTRSPVKSKQTNNHELCDREPHAGQIRSQSCSRSRPDTHSGPSGSQVISGAVQKPLTRVTTDYHEKNSCADENFVRKPLTVDEALKILTEAAAERSKTLSGNNPAFQNDGRKYQFRGVYKTFRANPVGGSQNFHRGNFKHQNTSKTATLDKDGTAMNTRDGQNPKAVGVQSHVPKQDMKKSKANKKAVSSDKKERNELLKGCEKFCENQNQNTGNTGKFEAKTGAQNKMIFRANNPTETEDKSQGKTSVKDCQRIDANQGGKTESTGKVEAKTGAPNPLLQCNPTEKKKKSKKKKAVSKNESVSHSLISDCEHVDNSNDKIGVARNTESETAPSNDLKNENVKNKVVPGDNFREPSSSESTFLEECLNSLVLNDVIKGEALNGEESASRELNSSRGDSEPGVRSSSPDNPTVVDTSSKDTSDFRFPGKDTRPNSRRNLQMTDPGNTEDEDGANVSNSSANSFGDLYLSGGAVAQDAAAYPFLDLQRKTILRDDNKDKSESHGSPDTNKVITLPNIIIDNTSVKYAKDVNVGGDGELTSSQGEADPNHSQVGVRTEDAAAFTGVGTGGARVGGTDSASSGSSSIPTNEVITPPLPIVESVKTEESQDLHKPEWPRRDTKVLQLLSLRAGSSGKSANAGTGNNSRSDAEKECVIC